MLDIRLMKDEQEDRRDEPGMGFLSVVAGALVCIIIGALLMTFVKPLFDKFFSITDYDQSASVRRNDLILGLTLFCWLFIGSLAGGISCTLISNGNDIMHVLISSLISIALIFVVSGEDIFGEGHMFTTIFILLSVPLGNLTGGAIGRYVKRKRERARGIEYDAERRM